MEFKYLVIREGKVFGVRTAYVPDVLAVDEFLNAKENQHAQRGTGFSFKLA